MIAVSCFVQVVRRIQLRPTDRPLHVGVPSKKPTHARAHRCAPATRTVNDIKGILLFHCYAPSVASVHPPLTVINAHLGSLGLALNTRLQVHEAQDSTTTLLFKGKRPASTYYHIVIRVALIHLSRLFPLGLFLVFVLLDAAAERRDQPTNCYLLPNITTTNEHNSRDHMSPNEVYQGMGARP